MSTTKRTQRIEAFGREARRHIGALPAATGIVQQLRALGAAAFTAAELPTPKTEAWKYSRIGPLLETGLLDRVAPGEARIAPIAGLDSHRLAIVDGLPQVAAAELPPGLSVSRFSALRGEDRDAAERLAGRLAVAADRPFVALNGALLEDGLLIRVAAGRHIKRPIELILAQGDLEVPRGAHPRVLVVLEPGARATLVERHLGRSLALTNAVVEIAVEQGARLDHLRLATEAGAGRWLGALEVEVGRDAGYDLSLVDLGAAFRRNEIGIHLAGPGAEAEVRGAGLTRDGQHLDCQMNLAHHSPQARSRQRFRLIAGETSRAVLNGRIHIERGAGKSDAALDAKGLLLTRGAEIDLKPELEIYADDVQCAHGATLGQLDARALFYLRSRGIDEPGARSLLSFAFLAEIVAGLPCAAVREAVGAALRAAFAAPAQEEPA
jgi:Fe-S cluster assembly protein SufD